MVFNALHGTPGEDGTVQGMMDLMGLRYTHSGLETSVIAIDKELTKMVLVPHGIRMPAGRVVRARACTKKTRLPRPFVVKPVNEGSSVGVAIVTDDGNYGNPIGRDVEGPWHRIRRAARRAVHQGPRADCRSARDEPLAVTELKPKAGFYDYDAKYTDGLTQHVCPAEVPYEIACAMMDMAARAHALLGCKGASRSDFRWDDELGEAGVYLLEVNTQPGMTPLSLVPEQAKSKGIAYGELVERLIDGGAPMSAAHVRRGGAPRQDAQEREGRGPEEDRQAAARRPGAREQGRGPRFRRVHARDRARRAGRAGHSGQGRARGRQPRSASAGFTVSGYQIVGIDHMDRSLVDEVVTDELRRAADEAGRAKAPQALVDVAAIRERLLRFGWVKDARVLRRLPDTLVIDIVERKPAALWQSQGQLALIDSEGVVLDRVPVDKMPDLPLLIGPGANGAGSSSSDG